MKKTTACAAMLFVGCSGGHGGKGGDGPQGGGTPAAFRALGGRAELEQVIRDNTIAEMNRRIDEELDSYLNGYGCQVEDADAAPAAGDGDGSSAPTDVSSTNNQVAGVDEADLVKTDGKYLYITANGALHILEAWPAESAKEVGKIELAGDARKLFVVGDRALVYVADGGQGDECTYGYDCDFTGDGTATRLVMLDIHDRTKPEKLREVSLTGSLLAARRIGNTVHTVVTDGAVEIPYDTFPEGLDYCGEATRAFTARAQFSALRARNEEMIRGYDVLGKLPGVTDSLNNQTSLLASCEGFYATSVQQGAAFTTVLSLDMTVDEPAQLASVVSRPGAVYASESTLYMAVRDNSSNYYGYWDESAQGTEETSAIHAFRIGDRPELTAYLASGSVPGHVLNQFAMDEHEQHLRVATSIGYVPDPNSHSAITVLAQNGSALEVTGSIDGIAPTEDIRSVRFDGARGFVVTFKKTDPLFVFDLSNPEAPKVQSELKIPGFSTYMHMMDETHLLTIGYDADDQGEFAWFAGVMLQIFDVSNPEAPALTHKEIIGSRGSSSEALTNHLAFNYFEEKNLLAFPMHICEGGAGGSYGTDMTFNGLMVYDVTVDGGFVQRGRVSHPGFQGEYNDSACGNWWTAATSDVKRSVIMDDFVYSIASDVVRVQSLDALGSDIAEVSIAGKPCVSGDATYPDESTWTVEVEDGYVDQCSCQDGELQCGYEGEW